MTTPLTFAIYSQLPRWGHSLQGLACTTCGSFDVWSSAHPHAADEIIGYEWVRCRRCGRITDYWEARKARGNNNVETLFPVEEEYYYGKDESVLPKRLEDK